MGKGCGSFLSVSVCFCPFLSISIRFYQFLFISVRFCPFLKIFSSFLSVYVRFCQFLSVFVCFVGKGGWSVPVQSSPGPPTSPTFKDLTYQRFHYFFYFCFFYRSPTCQVLTYQNFCCFPYLCFCFYLHFFLSCFHYRFCFLVFVEQPLTSPGSANHQISIGEVGEDHHIS